LRCGANAWIVIYRLKSKQVIIMGLYVILIQYSLEGIKQSKERLSIAFIVNALGTEFIKPIIIGNHRKPRCFKNV